ncbi:response regulator transcription factor [candidate division KSB1 bacterium]
MKTRIVIVEDHDFIRSGLLSCLAEKKRFNTVAEFNNGQSALTHIGEYNPDVVILAAELQDENTTEVVKKILQHKQAIKIITIVTEWNRFLILNLLQAGVKGFLTLDCSKKELHDTFETVLRNEIYLTPKIASLISRDLIQGHKRKRGQALAALSNRERQVLRYLCDGKSSKQIAQKLSVSEKTINVHRHHIMRKLNVNSLVDLLKLAINENLISVKAH